MVMVLSCFRFFNHVLTQSSNLTFMSLFIISHHFVNESSVFFQAQLCIIVYLYSYLARGLYYFLLAIELL